MRVNFPAAVAAANCLMANEVAKLFRFSSLTRRMAGGISRNISISKPEAGAAAGAGLATTQLLTTKRV